MAASRAGGRGARARTTTCDTERERLRALPQRVMSDLLQMFDARRQRQEVIARQRPRLAGESFEARISILQKSFARNRVGSWFLGLGTWETRSLLLKVGH